MDNELLRDKPRRIVEADRVMPLKDPPRHQTFHCIALRTVSPVELDRQLHLLFSVWCRKQMQHCSY